MSEPSDPLRLSDDPSAGRLGDWLREGRAELPSEQQLANLAARLEPTFAAPAAPSAALSPLAKWLLGALGVAGFGLLAFTLRGLQEPPQEAANEAAPSASASAAVPAASLEAAAPPSAAVQASPAPADSASSGSTASATAARKPLPPSEAALLEQARAALASDPARALALTRQHETRFPSGALKQEREVIAIEALRRLGRAKAASERAGSFEQAFPDSAHRRAVEGGLSK